MVLLCEGRVPLVVMATSDQNEYPNQIPVPPFYQQHSRMHHQLRQMGMDTFHIQSNVLLLMSQEGEKHDKIQGNQRKGCSFHNINGISCFSYIDRYRSNKRLSAVVPQTENKVVTSTSQLSQWTFGWKWLWLWKTALAVSKERLKLSKKKRFQSLDFAWFCSFFWNL